jgi:hypothetical protein
VFTIKGKDALAPGAVNAYRSACILNGLDAQAEQVDRARQEIADWQSRHPDLVKLPDHQHVPATAEQVPADALPWYRGDVAAIEHYLLTETADGTGAEYRRHLMRISALSIIDSITRSVATYMTTDRKLACIAAVNRALASAIELDMTTRPQSPA